MSDPVVPSVGAILSADIAVPEHEREARFYSHVLGTGENPLWREDLLNNQGVPIIGLGPRSPEYAELPLQWMPHIHVADVAASVERAQSLGGTELMHGKNDDGTSQWAVLLDANGAAFGIVPVASAEAPPPTEDAATGEAAGPAGCISWFDLTVSDAPGTRDFYRQVIGWSVQEVEMEAESTSYADYSLCGDDGSPAAGICHARGENLGLPPVWLMYLPVGDLAESLRRVREEGGKVLKETPGTDGQSAYAVIQDPVGACLALVPG